MAIVMAGGLAARSTLDATASHNVPAIALTVIGTPFNSPIGIDHHEPTNKLVLSVNYPSGSPLNLELVAADGSRAPHSTLAGATDELKIASVRTSTCMQGFLPRSSQATASQQGGSSASPPMARRWTTPGSTFQENRASFAAPSSRTATAWPVATS